MKIDGACHCGAITYEAETDPEQVVICHCTDCQTLSGSAFRTITPVPEASLKFLTGEPKIYEKIAESGNRRQQAFCANCGSQLYSATPDDGPKDIYMRVGTIRQRAELTPQLETWCRSKLPWLGTLAGQAIEKDTS